VITQLQLINIIIRQLLPVPRLDANTCLTNVRKVLPLGDAEGVYFLYITAELSSSVMSITLIGVIQLCCNNVAICYSQLHNMYLISRIKNLATCFEHINQ